MSLRAWAKEHLPYPVVTALARAGARPFLEQESRCERIVEYAWVMRFLEGTRFLDFGYAGSYFPAMLSAFGSVDGVDLRQTPRDLSQCPRFKHYREIPVGAQYDTIVCVSVLEHHLDVRYWIRRFFEHLAPNGQMLLTFPTGPGQVFKGYREVTRRELPSHAQWTVVDWQGPNTEHRVSRLALVQLRHPAAAPQPTWRSDPTLGSESE